MFAKLIGGMFPDATILPMDRECCVIGGQVFCTISTRSALMLA